MTTPPRERLITDPVAVRLLWLPRQRRFLRPFLGRSASLAEAAQMLGVKKPAMSYWVHKLRDAGLIRETESATAAGRVARRYRSVADRLRVHMSDAPLDSHEGAFAETDTVWMQRLQPAMARALARQASQLDLTIEATASQGLNATLAPRPGAAARDEYVNNWARLWLTADERESLRQELDALFDRYGALSDRRHKRAVALLHVAMAPDTAR